MRNGVVICVWVSTVGILWKVAGRVFSRAASLDGVNDHPFGALRRRVVGGEGDLTRPTTMYSRTRKGELLRGADSHVRDCSASVAGGFAWEV